MSIQVSTFEVGGTLFGVAVSTVREIFRTGPVARVPLAPSYVAGLISLRGHILTVAALGPWLSLAGTGEGRMTIVAQTRHGLLGLLVDEVGEVIDVEPEWEEPTPDSFDERLKQSIHRVYKLPSRLLLQLDVDALPYAQGLNAG